MILASDNEMWDAFAGARAWPSGDPLFAEIPLGIVLVDASRVVIVFTDTGSWSRTVGFSSRVMLKAWTEANLGEYTTSEDLRALGFLWQPE
jgi:hypothetical protein